MFNLEVKIKTNQSNQYRRINGVCGNRRKWMTANPRAIGRPLINNVSVRGSSSDSADLGKRGEFLLVIFVGMFVTIC